MVVGRFVTAEGMPMWMQGALVILDPHRAVGPQNGQSR